MKTTLCCVLWSTCSAVSVPFIPLDEVTARAARGRKHGLLNLKLIGDILFGVCGLCAVSVCVNCVCYEWRVLYECSIHLHMNITEHTCICFHVICMCMCACLLVLSGAHELSVLA